VSWKNETIMSVENTIHDLLRENLFCWFILLECFWVLYFPL